MVELFGLAMILEIRDHIISITDCYGNSWEIFSHALKVKYFLQDADHVTKKLFLEWIERPNKNLQATKLLREFERQYSQLSKVEKLTLEPNKVDLFLQAADGELQGKLELLLEDKEEDEGLTTKWKNVEDVVGLLAKRKRRKDMSNIPKTVQAPKVPIRTTPPIMPTIQPLTSLSKKVDMGMEEIIRGLKDLQIKLDFWEEFLVGSLLKDKKLEPLLEDKEEDEGLTTKWKNVEDVVELLTKKERRKDRSNIPKTVQAPKAPVRTTPPTMPTVQPSTFLSKKADMGMEEIIRGMRDLQIKLKDGKIALKNKEDLLQTNFGKGGMRALVQDYLKEHETVARESTSYGARVDDEIGGSTKTSEFWASTVSTMQEGKLPREALLRTAATIRGRTGWKDPVESLSVHAYIAKSQHEALMEEKRRGNFDDTREGNSFKRQTRGDKAREAASQKDTSVSLEEKTTETKDKDKSIAYKLLSDIEAATNLKGVLEERILNAKVEFTLKKVLGIAKKEFHDVIIDSIKRKRQLMDETGMSHAIDARICRDEEEVDIGYKQPTNEKNGYNQ
uniref:Predicted protein n=1 Tax=Physcomitrium patens TaxID=3218 RepID=A9U6F0_PHYPA